MQAGSVLKSSSPPLDEVHRMSESRSSEVQKQEALESLRSIPLFSRVNQTDLEEIASLLIERKRA